MKQANFKLKTPKISFLVLAIMAMVAVLGMSFPSTINADLKNTGAALSPTTLIHNGHLTICKIDKTSYEVVKTISMMTTAYTSDPAETDDTPLITASGTHVQDGTIATNILPFGTKLEIEGFGDQIFTVEDRMNSKYDGKKMLDIWMDKKVDAKEYGARIVKVYLMEN